MFLTQEVSARLDRLGAERPSPTPENAGAYRAWRDKVWILLAEQYTLPDQADTRADDTDYDAMVQLMMAEIGRFDPAKGTLSTFLGARIKRRRQTAETRARQVWNRVDHLDDFRDDATEAKGEDRARRADQVAAPAHQAEDVYQLYESSALAQQVLAAMVLRFAARKGPANNPRRLRYYRMWYTEKIKCMAEQTASDPQLRALQDNEQTLFGAMLTAYLDYFTPRDCRTVQDLVGVPVALRATGEPLAWSKDHWLPARVPIGYLQQVEGDSAANSTITAQRTAYEEALRAVLQGAGA